MLTTGVLQTLADYKSRPAAWQDKGHEEKLQNGTQAREYAHYSVHPYSNGFLPAPPEYGTLGTPSSSSFLQPRPV